MSGSDNKTTTTSNSEPWKTAQPYLESNMEAVDALPQSEAFGQSMHVGLSGQSRAGLQGMENIAQNAGGVMGKPLDYLSQGMDQIQGDMSGNFSQPFMDVLGRAQQDAMDSANLSMSGAGRYGSGAHSDAVAGAVGDVTANAMLNQMNQARGDLLNYSSAMPGAYQNSLMPSQTMLEAGSLYESNQANALNDQARQFYEAQDIPFNDLARKNAIFTGAGQLGGTSRATATTPGVNYGQSALGYGTAALGGK